MILPGSFTVDKNGNHVPNDEFTKNQNYSKEELKAHAEAMKVHLPPSRQVGIGEEKTIADPSQADKKQKEKIMEK